MCYNVVYYAVHVRPQKPCTNSHPRRTAYLLSCDLQIFGPKIILWLFRISLCENSHGFQRQQFWTPCRNWCHERTKSIRARDESSQHYHCLARRDLLPVEHTIVIRVGLVPFALFEIKLLTLSCARKESLLRSLTSENSDSQYGIRFVWCTCFVCGTLMYLVGISLIWFQTR